jgi:hypothetical protein
MTSFRGGSSDDAGRDSTPPQVPAQVRIRFGRHRAEGKVRIFPASARTLASIAGVLDRPLALSPYRRCDGFLGDHFPTAVVFDRRSATAGGCPMASGVRGSVIPGGGSGPSSLGAVGSLLTSGRPCGGSTGPCGGIGRSPRGAAGSGEDGAGMSGPTGLSWTGPNSTALVDNEHPCSQGYAAAPSQVEGLRGANAGRVGIGWNFECGTGTSASGPHTPSTEGQQCITPQQLPIGPINEASGNMAGRQPAPHIPWPVAGMECRHTREQPGAPRAPRAAINEITTACW